MFSLVAHREVSKCILIFFFLNSESTSFIVFFICLDSNRRELRRKFNHKTSLMFPPFEAPPKGLHHGSAVYV